jgi:hypothetical protein
LSIASAIEPGTLAIRFAPNDSGDARIAAYIAHGTAIDVLRQFNTVAELGFTDQIELRPRNSNKCGVRQSDSAIVGGQGVDECGRLIPVL